MIGFIYKVGTDRSNESLVDLLPLVLAKLWRFSALTMSPAIRE